jgi:hypothetical protein
MVSRSKKAQTTAKRDRDWPPKPIDPSKLSDEEQKVYWGRMTEREAAQRAIATFRRLAREAQDRAEARTKRDDEGRGQKS